MYTVEVLFPNTERWSGVATFDFRYMAEAFIIHMNIVDSEKKYRLGDE